MVDRFVHRLSSRLERDLPGTTAQVIMAPVYRADPGMADIAGKNCRDAAVLGILHDLEVNPAILFIERPVGLKHHPGQIAFPGGRRESDETTKETALRETREEIGIDPATLSVLGVLTPLYVPPSRFCVYPYVGYAERLGTLVPQPGEVADIFSVRISDLLVSGSRTEVDRHVGGRTYRVPCYSVDGRLIWGATAMILSELLAVLSDVLPVR